MKVLRLISPIFFFSIFACGGQTGEIAPPICDGPIVWQGQDVDGSIGFSANEVIQTIQESTTSDLTWANGTQTTVTLTYAYDSTIQNSGMIAFVDAQDELCSPRLEVPVTVTVSTADGLLNETLVSYMVAEVPNSATLQADSYADNLTGSIDVEALVPTGTWDPSSARLFFSLTLNTSSSEGEITINTHQEEGGDAAHFVLASW